MKIIRLCGTLLATNTYLIADGLTGSAAVVDPAAPVSDILSAAEKLGAGRIEKILLTHGHFDHLGTADALAERTGASVLVSEPDAPLLCDGEKNGSLLFLRRPVLCRSVPQKLRDGDLVPVGSETLAVRLTPGHTRGSVCFFAEEAVFTGDTVFADGYGRTDLYGGDEAVMRRTLLSLLPALAGRMLYPGHGAYGFRREPGSVN